MQIKRRVFMGMGASLASFAFVRSASAAEVTLRIHTLVQSPHPYNDIAEMMKQELEARSNGRIEVRVFDSGQLGQDPAVIGEMAFGTIDLMVSTTSNAAQQIPELSIFTMPYLFESMDEALEKVGPGTAIHAHFEEVYARRGVGLKLLALGLSGARNLATVNIDVEGPESLRGIRMRTPPSPMDSETWSAFGMLPVTVAWGELYAAMQTGVAGAMESSLPGYMGAKLYEVAPRLALTEHTLQVNHISVSEVTWNRLPEDLQELLVEVATEANIYGVEMSKQYDAELVEVLETNHGVTVSRPDKAAFIELVAPRQQQLAADLNLVAEYELLRP